VYLFFNLLHLIIVFCNIAFGAAIMMTCVTYYDEDNNINESAIEEIGDSNIEDLTLHDEDEVNDSFRDQGGNVQNHLHVETNSSKSQKSSIRQAVAAVDLLVHNNKMKYLSFINTSVSVLAAKLLLLLLLNHLTISSFFYSSKFGLCTAFVTLVVNGQVIRVALHDYSSRYVGMFTALSSSVAAVLSWAFGALDWISHSLVIEQGDSSIRVICVKCLIFFEPNKERILTLGAVSYLVIALLFLVFPSYVSWNFSSLLLVYILLGIGRSTYEGEYTLYYSCIH